MSAAISRPSSSRAATTRIRPISTSRRSRSCSAVFDVYVYAPTPVACYTWWNYACGTEVNLFTSSPWAHTCSPCPPVVGPDGKNRWVAFLAIGAHGLNNIYGTAQDLAGSTTPTNHRPDPGRRALGQHADAAAGILQRSGGRGRALLSALLAQGRQRRVPAADRAGASLLPPRCLHADGQHAGLDAGTAGADPGR